MFLYLWFVIKYRTPKLSRDDRNEAKKDVENLTKLYTETTDNESYLEILFERSYNQEWPIDSKLRDAIERNDGKPPSIPDDWNKAIQNENKQKELSSDDEDGMSENDYDDGNVSPLSDEEPTRLTFR